MEKKKSSGKIKAILINSNKVRIDSGVLDKMMESESEVKNLIFLLSDADTFIEQVKNEISVSNVKLFETNLDKIEFLSADMIAVCRNEIPGPLAIASVSWESVAKIILWDCVVQVEMNQFYTATKEQ